MKTKKIIEYFKDIEKIAGYQIKRLENPKAINKMLILRQSLDIIGFRILGILKETEWNKKKK
jgi:hypothetical protein